jgi:CheY-like chemotaxis protein
VELSVRFRVLLVEDDPFVRSYAVGSLKTMGYEVTPAGDAREAQRLLREETEFDVLFTDIVMPGGTNGWELAKRAEKLQPQIKVLLTSGYALEALSKMGRIPREAAVLSKPYRKATLRKALDDLLGEGGG